ncbi:hypothetical protein BDQ12DRAFT_686909 [Crucibulum laeve]|uniref:Arrestin C-terminal-like domain-containing protein n=1 Tax=Crucibulum laeve TaxID=68775 RepID=A0A5C3M5Q1_9AGAR|nr:hypothetical protein BDQ12DRAFT_686909 [Crucibulum laeve]
MSQVKLTLRPPPNVDFVHGYPGIPPGPDRQQAAVKGAIEVRVPQQGVKAKWVRIELRKVETLPGGGQANTFYDFVGPSPVNLWTSPDEYGILHTQDFPFSIRIPESIPPSVALENRAGISYELIASVCTKGKKGFLRKAKSVVSTSQASVIIDKHELHSTWPIYCQPETRHIAQEGVNLIVQRTNNCYGPGDRISVTAAIKSDSLHTVILRGYEMTLKETTVYRASPHAAGKKAAPQVKVTLLSETKFAVNDTLYGGMTHQAELTCGVSANHTTTTLNAARHIDVTYTLSIKALLATGNPLVMDLPVIISNWQRHVSQEAIRRIGPTPNLSLVPANSLQPTIPAQITRVDPIARPSEAATLPTKRAEPDLGFGRNTSAVASAYNTLPVQNSGYSTASPITKADELGYGVGAGYGPKPSYATHQSTNSRSNNAPAPADELGARTGGSSNTGISSTTGAGRRPNSARSTGAGNNRFTITNAQPSEIPEDTTPPASVIRERSTGSNTPGSGGRAWPTAEEEKLKLYENARAKVEKKQSVPIPRVSTPPPADRRASPPPRTTPTTTPSKGGPWLTAEEEKQRLFKAAQEAVQKKQNLQYSPPPSVHNRSNSDLSQGLHRAASSSKVPSAGAALYSQAMMSRSGSQQAKPSAIKTSPAKAVPVVPQYMSAEQEKAALRRYEEARQAVDRTQASTYEGGLPNGYQSGAPTSQSAPAPYDSLYPAAGGSHAPAQDLPPPFESTSGIPAAHLSEKERMRRAYEARDAAAVLARNHSQLASPPPVSPPSASPPPFSGGNQYSSVIAEKEALRRAFEARDAAASPPRSSSPPNPPLRVTSPGVASPRVTSPGRTPSSRPAPVPPASGSSRALTAAEEKAILRAKYDAEDAQPKPRVNGNTNGNGNARAGSSTAPPSPTNANFTTSSPPPPPPLMPRPPAEYIQETREEDARVSRFVSSSESPVLDDQPPIPSGLNIQKVNGPALDMQPFTPFTPGFGVLKAPGPPPPLPPKPAGE